MISVKSRAYWLGASDASRIVGNRKTETWQKWWTEKLGIYAEHFDNRYTLAGTYYEHKILRAVEKDFGIKLALDLQIKAEKLRVRVNYDGVEIKTATIYECKTYQAGKTFKVTKDYWRQAQMEMWGLDTDRLFIVAYPLEEDYYNNYWLDIDPEKIEYQKIERDDKFIDETLLPNIEELAECIRRGIFPEDINE